MKIYKVEFVLWNEFAQQYVIVVATNTTKAVIKVMEVFGNIKEIHLTRIPLDDVIVGE